MLRTSSSTTSTVLPTSSSSDRCSRSSICCLSGGRSATTRCRNSAVSSSSRSGDSTPFTTTLRANACSCSSSSGDSSRPVKTTTGRSRQRVVRARSGRAPRSRTCRAAAGRARRSRTARRDSADERRLAGVGGDDVDVVVRRAARGCSAARRRCPRRRAAACGAAARRLLMRSSAALQAFGRRRLVTNENAPRARPCCRSSSSVTICTGMCRVCGSCLSWLSTVQPSMSGRNTSSEIAVGRNCARQRQRVVAAHRDQDLEAVVAREVDQDARVVRVVLDDRAASCRRASMSSPSSAMRLGAPLGDAHGRERGAGDRRARHVDRLGRHDGPA